MRTGYWARAHEDRHDTRTTKVHIEKDDKGLCGYIPHKTMKFQWCAMDVYLPYVECKKCKEKYQRIEERSKLKLRKP